MASITVSARELMAVANFAAKIESVNPAFNVVNVEISDGRYTLVATDGHNMAAYSQKFGVSLPTDNTVSLTIPIAWIKTLKNKSATITITFNTMEALSGMVENYSLYVHTSKKGGVDAASFDMKDKTRYPQWRNIFTAHKELSKDYYPCVSQNFNDNMHKAAKLLHGANHAHVAYRRAGDNVVGVIVTTRDTAVNQDFIAAWYPNRMVGDPKNVALPEWL